MALIDPANAQLRRLLWLGVLTALLARPVPAAVFTVPFDNGETRKIPLADIAVDGTAYVPLADLVRELGGEWQIQDNEVRVTLFDAAARLTLDARRVFLQTEPFDLQWPVIQRDNRVLLAVDDAAPFFLKAFRVPLEREPEAETPPAPEEPADPALLESMERPVAAEVPAAAETPPPSGGQLQVDTIVLDPGHGGSDAGASMAGGAAEKEVTLAVAQLTAQALKEQTGLKVVLTRDEDVNLTDDDRNLVALEHPGSLFISLHCATSVSNRHHGIAVFYASAAPDAPGPRSLFSSGLRRGTDTVRESAFAAQALGDALAAGSDAPLVRVNALPLRNLNYLQSPGVLVELGYLTNPVEAAQLATPEYQQRLASALVDGIRRTVRTGGAAR